MNTRWGIDLGGTKIEGVVLDKEDPKKILCRTRIATEADQGYEHIIHRIALLVDQIEQEVGERPGKLGIGTPGVLDPDMGTMKNCNTTALNGQPLKDDLEAALQMPISIANDANCFALAEVKMGIVAEQYPEAKVVFGIIMGTGVGGAVVINGEVLYGRHGIGGEWGHNYMDESGGPSYCGITGCVETILAGPSLERYYQSISGEYRKLKEIVGRHHQGIDPHATATMDRLIYFFGRGVASIVNVLDPDVIVVGGGVGNIDLLYTEGAKSVEKFMFNPVLKAPLLKPSLGDSAGVFGAAFLV